MHSRGSGACSRRDLSALLDSLQLSTLILSSLEGPGIGVVNSCRNYRSTCPKSKIENEGKIFKIASMIRQCAKAKDVSEGKRVHKYMLESGLEGDRYLKNLIIYMYGKCGALQDARIVFDNIDRPNLFSWNIMAGAYAEHGKVDKAMDIFQAMPERNVVSWNGMIAACIQCRKLDDAFDLFQQMPERDSISWTVMLTGYIEHGQLDKALNFFWEMPEQDTVSSTVMFSACIRHSQLDQALEVFTQMPQRDLVSYNAMISACADQGYLKEALKTFDQMQLEGLRPDAFTFSSIIDACSKHAALDEGKRIHLLISQSSFRANVVVGGSLINMYAKCGSLNDARTVFEELATRDVISWNTIIAAYAQHGLVNDALQVFIKMHLEGMKPTEFAFVSILSACSHAGLMDQGYHFFVSLSLDHTVAHMPEQSSCIIDLLGRGGQLGEAESLMYNLPFQPTAAYWRALLSSCKTHGDSDLGKRVAEHVFKLDGENAAAYALLSSIYAADGEL